MITPDVVIAALSFEERCLAATQHRIASEDLPSSIVMLDYGSTATSGSDATSLRHSNWRTISIAAAQRGVRCTRHQINAYSMADLEEVVAQNAPQLGKVFVDISCMTRPHVLGLATALARRQGPKDWVVAYTKPLSYGDLNSPSSSGGWRDTLWLPLGDDPLLRNEGLALGLLAAGHEADRTGIALREVEPAAGVAIYSRRADRPDLHRAALDQNRLLFSYLRQLRMPGPRGRAAEQFFVNGGWEVIAIQLENAVTEVSNVVNRVVRAAEALDSPIIFVPFGPKSVVFVAAWVLARKCPNRSWAVYPVARTHPLGYSDGVLGTEYMSSFALEASTTP